MNTRYTALPVIAMVLKIIAFVVLLFGFINALNLFAVYSAPDATLWNRLIVALLSFGSSVVNFVLLLAASELIHVVLDIEENTRRSADTLAGGGPGTTPRA
jgi:hypothetical protein